MLMFGPYLVATALWVLTTIMIAIWVTRTYIHAILAIGLGRIKKTIGAPDPAVKLGGDLPFVTILLPVYNEARVIDRLLGAVTAIDYPDYEVIVADDSTEKTMLQHLRYWERRGKVKVVHRNKRTGFKAGALNNAMKHSNPRCRYVLFFDADYVPKKDIVWRMLKDFSGKDVAVVQGYTPHTLNATKNFLTKSTCLAFSSYCLVDIAARKRLEGFIPIFGSVFMITKDSLKDMGGFNESSLTEDWDLASRLTENGYRIMFDESISVPAECPSTFRGLVRQQMRWAEGITRDTKNHFFSMLHSRKANLMKKFDYLFYGFSSLNGILGSVSYVLTVIMFLINQRIIIALGVDRSLILGLGLFGQFLLFVAPIYIPLALVFASLVGLYRENEMSRLPWCACLFVVSLSLAPFIAFGGIKGLLLKRGSWTRTPKTGEVSQSE